MGPKHGWIAAVGALVFTAGATFAQVPPPAPSPPPDDNTPSIKVGTTVFMNYGYQTAPEIIDADGNSVNRSSFDVTRAYINVTGNISRLIAFRVTPDISRENDTTSSLSGSLEFRVKYAYLQANLDQGLTKGSWARFGIHQTPYLDYLEGIYRYRFQGTMFVEREGYFASADAGASFHYNFPSNFGDAHVGYYNGENYNKAEVNDQKAIMVRATVRPFANGSAFLQGLRGSVFYDHDAYVSNGERERLLVHATFEHKYVHAGVEYLSTTDQVSGIAATPEVEGEGYSIWATPKFQKGWEALLRYDHLTPNTSSDFAPIATAPNATTPFESQKRKRFIAGVAYWFPHIGNVSSALLVDYDAQEFDNITTEPIKIVALHALINY
jgi:hypothetical protein